MYDHPVHSLQIQLKCSACSRLRRAWLGTTLLPSGGGGCPLIGWTPGRAASHCFRASRSKLWPPLPYSTGSRMTSPLSEQRHQSAVADGCTAGTATSVLLPCSTFGAACGAAAAAAGSCVSDTGTLLQLAAAAWGSGVPVVAASGLTGLSAASLLPAAATACGRAALLRARLAAALAALLGFPEALTGCSSSCSHRHQLPHDAGSLQMLT